MKLVIDAGHGGYDSGAVGNGLVEKELTLQIARRVRDILSANYPINIKMTRDSDVFISYQNVLILLIHLVQIILSHFTLIVAVELDLKVIFTSAI